MIQLYSGTRNNKVVFEVEFDKEAWSDMTDNQKSSWIEDVSDAINDHARVSLVVLGGLK